MKTKVVVDVTMRQPDLHVTFCGELPADGIHRTYDVVEIEELAAERDDLARALFKIRSLTMRGRGDTAVAEIACDAVRSIDETPLFACDDGN